MFNTHRLNNIPQTMYGSYVKILCQTYQLYTIITSLFITRHWLISQGHGFLLSKALVKWHNILSSPYSFLKRFPDPYVRCLDVCVWRLKTLWNSWKVPMIYVWNSGDLEFWLWNWEPDLLWLSHKSSTNHHLTHMAFHREDFHHSKISGVLEPRPFGQEDPLFAFCVKSVRHPSELCTVKKAVQNITKEMRLV